MPSAQFINYKRDNKYANNKLASVQAASHVAIMGVPAKIRCNSCYKVKGPSAFSKSKQAILVKHMSKTSDFSTSETAHISCIGCSGGQVTELRCNCCDLTKAVTKFNKTQRKKDEPMCESCTAERRNAEPGGSSDDSNSDSEQSGSSDGDDDDDDEWQVTSSLGGIDLNGSGSRNGSAATYRSGPPSTVANSGVPLGSRTNSTTAKASTAASSSSTTGGGKWARVRAVKKSRLQSTDKEESASPQVSSDEDSDAETMYTA